MIRSRNLDDQTFDGIVDSAVNRIPYIYPEWTDYNAHDPGITLLELFAWYKEMQQYHMNVVTDDMKLKLLKLVGKRPREAAPATCLVTFKPEERLYPRLTRLRTPDGVPFELAEYALVTGDAIEKVYIAPENGVREVTEAFLESRVALPMTLGKNSSALIVGIRLAKKRETLRIWFGVETGGVRRNPFADEGQLPRRVTYEFYGAGKVEPLADETHALSRSGFVTFAVPETWERSDCGLGLEPLWYIRVEIPDAGCEESVRVTDAALNRFRAKQRETCAKLREFTVSPERSAQIVLSDAISRENGTHIFVRRAGGWESAPQTAAPAPYEDRTIFTFDATDAADDGAANVIAISQDSLRYSTLIRDSNGLPGQRITPPIDERRVLRSEMRLFCGALCEDGVVRPAVWRYTDDLYGAGPRDLVFTLDRRSYDIVFGDGVHGAVVPAGKDAIYIAALALTYASDGNAPASGAMTVEGCKVTVAGTDAFGGAEEQSVEDAVGEFTDRLASPAKCVTAEDYEALALRTPGVRILAAKALPMFDPAAPVHTTAVPIVTLVVIPAGEQERPLPNEWFLQTVREYVERRRTICTRINVVPPLYVGVDIYAALLTHDADIEEKLRARLAGFFAIGCGHDIIGRPLVHTDIFSAIGTMPEVLRLAVLRLTPELASCRAEANGDLTIPRHAAPYLRSLTIKRL